MWNPEQTQFWVDKLERVETEEEQIAICSYFSAQVQLEKAEKEVEEIKEGLASLLEAQNDTWKYAIVLRSEGDKEWAGECDEAMKLNAQVESAFGEKEATEELVTTHRQDADKARADALELLDKDSVDV